MTTCKYCGSVLPDGAGFCGQCGRGTGEIANIPVNNNAVTVFSRSSSYNSDPDAPTRPLIADPEAPTRPLTSDVDLPPYTKQTKQSTPNNFPLLSAGAVAGGQIVPGGAPVVSGTPQVGGAASVSGTPDLSGLTEEVPHADHLQPQMLHGEHRQPDIFHGEHQQPEMFHGEHQQPQLFHGEGQQPQLLHGERQQLLHADHQQPQLFHADHQQPQLLHGEHQQPQLFHADHQQPQLAYAAHVRPGVVQDHAAHQLPQVVHADHQQPQVSRISYGGKASRAVRPSFLTTVVSVAVVVATVTAVLFVLYLNKTSSSAAPPPAVAINGSAIPGQAVIMRGSNFVAGSTVTVTLDNQSLGASNGPTTMSMLQLLGQQTPLSGTPVKVSSDGTFSLTIHIDPNWSISSTHTVRVYDQSGAFVLSKDIVVISDTTPRVADCTSSTSVKKVNIGPITEGQSQTVSAPFTLCTQGKGSVNWTSNWDQNQAPWLQIDHTSGQAQAPQMQQLTLSAFSVNLNAGTYTTTVTFSGGNAEVSLEVTLVVQAKPTPTLQPPTPTPVPLPCIKANTQALTFASQEGQGDPAAQNVTITNCGPTGNWSATTTTQSGGNWLSSSATTGSLGAGAAQNVAIKVSNANMVAGTYKGIVTLSIGTQTVTVNVTLNVSVKPICVQPATGTLSFNSAHGATPGAQSLALNNPCGAGNWSATADANWITINPANGSIAAKGSANVSIGTTIDTLGAGSHTGTITFTSGTTTAKVSVTLTIQPPATCITLSDSTLSFSE
ncbi:MAG TPA: hypothetical protein VFB12_25815, partial [Ktedonobacteraceae bacterium]|nr:hypothetical protein [Ktedonobacteraceae bacterium]